MKIKILCSFNSSFHRLRLSRGIVAPSQKFLIFKSTCTLIVAWCCRASSTEKDRGISPLRIKSGHSLPVFTRKTVLLPPWSKRCWIWCAHSLSSIIAMHVLPLPVGRQTIKFSDFARSIISIFSGRRERWCTEKAFRLPGTIADRSPLAQTSNHRCRPSKRSDDPFSRKQKPNPIFDEKKFLSLSRQWDLSRTEWSVLFFLLLSCSAILFRGTKKSPRAPLKLIVYRVIFSQRATHMSVSITTSDGCRR